MDSRFLSLKRFSKKKVCDKYFRYWKEKLLNINNLAIILHQTNFSSMNSAVLFWGKYLYENISSDVFLKEEEERRKQPK